MTEEELWDWADRRCQKLVTESEARNQWHTTWLTTEELAIKVSNLRDSIVLDAGGL